MRRSEDHVPFSWALALICLLHVSVWSIGVIESHSRDFFVRETASTKSAYLATNKCQRIQQETFGFHLEQQTFLQEVHAAQNAQVLNTPTVAASLNPRTASSPLLLLFTAEPSESDEAAEARVSLALSL